MILLLYVSFSACKKDKIEIQSISNDSAKKTMTSSAKKNPSVASTQLFSSSLDENAWNNYATYSYYPEEIEYDGGATELTKIRFWVVAQQVKGFWTVYSTETLHMTNKGKMPQGYAFKFTGITHNGSIMDSALFLPVSLSEAVNTPYFNDVTAAMSVLGNVYYFSFNSGAVGGV